MIGFVLVVASSHALAQVHVPSLPDPLRPSDAARIAMARRAEVRASLRAVDAARERPRYVGALEDPEIAVSVDHLPVMLDGIEVSTTVEQRFPLSRLRGRRERFARAGLARSRSAVGVTRLTVALEAELAVIGVYEAREMRLVVTRQRELARQVTVAVTARYSAGMATQADVLRAETEVARLGAELDALAAEVAGMEAMLRAALALAPSVRIPPVVLDLPAAAAPPVGELRARAARRPEIAVARAELRAARAEIDVMRSMDAPMLMVRAGGAYTMTDGAGAMLMVGMSLPLWRGARRASVAEARAMASMAEAELAAMLRMSEGQAAEARAQLVSAQSRLRAQRVEIVPLATRTVEAMLGSYASGMMPLVGVFESLTMLWDTRERLVASEVAVATAWARLRRVTGGARIETRR
ncbi:MAG: TolC family protein [Deltaproteobacteria bacterium]|nr:TolC family protein [Deltaproteobacteria bacterium]